VIKMVVLLFGLGIGFGVGVYWGVNHPVEAKRFADEEERRVLEKQKELLAKLKSKLDQLTSSHSATASTAKPVGSGFVAGGAAGAAKDPEVDNLKVESDQQLKELDKLLKK